MAEHIVDHKGLSKGQVDLIEQFEADFNGVDHFLRKDLGRDRQVSFTRVVYEYSERHALWRDAEVLRTIAEIRNAIVHGKTEPYRYVAIPTPAIAEQLRKCREGLINLCPCRGARMLVPASRRRGPCHPESSKIPQC
jgi:hypothetical protein